ncbi:MAG: hypothetical protein JO187_08960 [Acidobacteria bacterium]|nr:hypothetical protein [Acidobacteriota bacterium]
MLLIEHRVNTREHLARVPACFGVEIDIRDYDGDLRCVHDPLQSGERLDDLLAGYHHALAIFNVKCDGLESRILELAEKHGVGDYFFLDVANPTLVQLIRRGVKKVAVRYSEHEPIESAMSFEGKVDWVWVDCFTHLPLDPDIHRQLQRAFKICIVSPELQQHPRECIREYSNRLRSMPVDAVCTDFCADWT